MSGVLVIVVEVECDPHIYNPRDVAAAMFGDPCAVDFDPASSAELLEAKWLNDEPKSLVGGL